MPKSGDQPHQSRNHRGLPHDKNSRAGKIERQSSLGTELSSSGEMRLREFQFHSPDSRSRNKRDASRSHRLSDDSLRENRPNLWKWLFGQDSRRTRRTGSRPPRRDRPARARASQLSASEFSTSDAPQEVWQSIFPVSRERNLSRLARRANARDTSRLRVTEQSQQGGIFRFPDRGLTGSKLEDSRRTRQEQDHASPAGSERFRKEPGSRPFVLVPPTSEEERDSRGVNPPSKGHQRKAFPSENSSQNNPPISLASLRDARNRARRTASTPDPSLAQPAKNPSSTQPRQRAISRSHPRSISAALYFIRILILGLGVGVLAGTLLSVRDPASRLNQDQQADQKSIESGNRATGQMPNLVQEITPLKAALQALAAKTPELTPGIFVVDLDGNAYVDINGSQSLPAASTIKVPILIAFFQDVDAGKIRLDELLTLRADLVAKEAGDMQYQPLGTRYTALETAYKMITISDNTATNLLIARIGEGDPKRGMEILNQRFKSWGLTGTTLNNLLPDLGGTNLTSARDLSLLMTRISQGDLVSLRSRDRLLSIMRATENDSLLPQGLGKGATIAHKTGGIASVLGDVGLVDLPNGKLYTIAVLAKRPPNSEQAYDLIQQTSRLVYQYLVRPPVSSRPNATPPKTSPSDQASPEADENRTSNPSSSDP